MTHVLAAAKSGWGKSWFTQALIERNLDSVDVAVVLDYKGEYRGLLDAGLAKWMGVGGQEAGLGVDAWKRAIEANESLVVERVGLTAETWREEVAAPVIAAVRELDADGLVVIDEAHFIAPQTGGYPDAIQGLATTGRGEGVSSIWSTQRPATLDETVIAEVMVRLLGGFRSDADLKKLAGVVEYPVDVHTAGGVQVPALAGTGLEADGAPISVRRFRENGRTTGSEWIRSDDEGELARIDTRSDVSMSSTHHGAEGHHLEVP